MNFAGAKMVLFGGSVFASQFGVPKLVKWEGPLQLWFREPLLVKCKKHFLWPREPYLKRAQKKHLYIKKVSGISNSCNLPIASSATTLLFPQFYPQLRFINPNCPSPVGRVKALNCRTICLATHGRVTISSGNPFLSDLNDENDRFESLGVFVLKMQMKLPEIGVVLKTYHPKQKMRQRLWRRSLSLKFGDAQVHKNPTEFPYDNVCCFHQKISIYYIYLIHKSWTKQLSSLKLILRSKSLFIGNLHHSVISSLLSLESVTLSNCLLEQNSHEKK